MADVVRYVDTDVVGGLGDGVGRGTDPNDPTDENNWVDAYSSLNSWE